jgi:hypothetical protein
MKGSRFFISALALTLPLVAWTLHNNYGTSANASMPTTNQVYYLSAPPPVEARVIRPHPRMLVTQDSLPALREKLASPVYRQDVAALRASKDPTDQAFVYLVWEDAQALEIAKAALLGNNIPKWGGLEKSIQMVQAGLLYDWLYQSLTPAERLTAAAVVSQNVPQRLRAFSADGIDYYFNDMWARGPAFATVAALSLAGDDEWADEFIRSAYTNSHKVFSPYYGGAIDVLNTMSIDSGGGHQAGLKPGPGTNYAGFYLIGSSVFLSAWQSATGEQVLSKTNFFERYPFYMTAAYKNIHPPGEQAKKVLEYVTGLGTQDSADLSAWSLNRYGRAKKGLCLRLILGDLTRVTPKSPSDLNMATVTYLKGADLVVSRSDWSEDAVSVFMFARHWDTSRYEPESGSLGIYRGSKPLLVMGSDGKRNYSYENSSAMWIWEDGNMEKTLGQGSVAWNKLNNLEYKSVRPRIAANVYNEAKIEYRPETLSGFAITDGGFTATTRYEKLLRTSPVAKAERTIVQNEKSIRLTDTLEVPENAKVAWSLRLAETPIITGNVISTNDLTITLTNPEVEVYWSGGLGKELIGPTGQWHGHRKHKFKEGYSSDPDLVRQYGKGYVFAIPKNKSEVYEFDAKIEIR